MQDEFLIREIEKNLDFLGSRGMAATAAAISLLIKRFQTLKEAHRLLSEREDRLTTLNVNLQRQLENSESWVKRHENGVSFG